MRPVIRAFLLIAVGVLPAVSAQAPSGQAASAPTPACALLSVAEVREITGRREYPDHVDGDPDGEGAGGGSSCQYGGATFNPADKAPLLSLVLIRGKNWTERSRGFPLAAGCRREAVTGVGDDAYFASCPASRSKRSAPLYVKAGTNDLILQLDVEPPATEASVRQTLIALARAVERKLR